MGLDLREVRGGTWAEADVWLLGRAWVEVVVDGAWNTSTAANSVLDDAIFEVDEVLGSGVWLAARTGEEVKDVNTGTGGDVIAGPTSLKPNFLSA